MRYLVLLALGLFTIGCGDEFEITVKQELMAELQAKAESLIANKTCNGIDGCDVIAWGVDPCGNTRMFMVYAPGDTDVEMLEELAAKYNQLDSEINEIVGGAELLDCSVFLVKPQIDCIERSCEATSDPSYVVIN